MPVPLKDYLDSKNKCCICYFGNCDEYIMLLNYFRPFIEQTFNGLDIWIGCKDVFLNKYEKTINYENIKNNKGFAWIREIKVDLSSKKHPIYELLEESGLLNLNLSTKTTNKVKKCYIVSDGNIPTISLNTDQIIKIKSIMKLKGYEITSNQGTVVGVECLKLFEEGLAGNQTFLINTGLGSNLFKKMFPENQIINL